MIGLSVSLVAITTLGLYVFYVFVFLFLSSVTWEWQRHLLISFLHIKYSNFGREGTSNKPGNFQVSIVILPHIFST